MLGELIEEESGKITGKRVVDVEGPKIESSFTMNGRWVGQGDRKIYRSRKNKIPWISVLSYKSNKRRKTIIP
jgi:hypothetical protein